MGPAWLQKDPLPVTPILYLSKLTLKYDNIINITWLNIAYI